MSGRTPDRDGYQRLLEDARAGEFSHVAVENAERFGRNDTEALTAIDELHNLGVAIRFADYPDLDPIDPDDRIMVSLSFTLARRESMKLGQRVMGGLHTKLRSGGFVGLAPDGYVNVEQRVDLPSKSNNGRYTRWIEPDPAQFKVWRLVWDLLLTDSHTLEQICEELHQRGYNYRSGRPFITIRNGRRVPAVNTLSKCFRNWFYAGWVVSPKAGIPPKTVRGTWKPVLHSRLMSPVNTASMIIWSALYPMFLNKRTDPHDHCFDLLQIEVGKLPMCGKITYGHPNLDLFALSGIVQLGCLKFVHQGSKHLESTVVALNCDRRGLPSA